MTQGACATCGGLLLHDATCLVCAFQSSDLSLPRHIGPYPVLRQIGVGGMGTVYAGQQACPSREVAIKVIKDGIFADERLRARFLREREIAGRLEHPNIIRVYDAGEDADGRLFYVMEIAARGTLREYMRTVALTQDEAIRMMIEVAFAVDYAHRHGVVHRDLKPENILIGEDRRARVTDFGVARLCEETEDCADRQSHRSLVGSYAYMAPEQAGHSASAMAPPGAEPGPAADIFSLGAMLYELIHGASPFPASSREELLERLAMGPPSGVRGVFRGREFDLEAVTMKALSMEPGRRYETAATFAEDLRRVLGGRVPRARPQSVRGRVASVLFHHAAAIGIVISALSVGGAVIATIIGLYLKQELLEQAAARDHVLAAVRAIRTSFDVPANLSRELALAPCSIEALTDTSSIEDCEQWLARKVRNSPRVSSAFLMRMDGRAALHAPREVDAYYQEDFQHRLYFQRANLAQSQRTGIGVFVSPLFKSHARDRKIKLAFSAPVYDSEERQLGVAVVTMELEELVAVLRHPELVLIAPSEMEAATAGGPAFARVTMSDPNGEWRPDKAEEEGEQPLVGSVDNTGYVVTAKVPEPRTDLPGERIALAAFALLGLCIGALSLIRFANPRADRTLLVPDAQGRHPRLSQ